MKNVIKIKIVKDYIQNRFRNNFKKNELLKRNFESESEIQMTRILK